MDVTINTDFAQVEVDEQQVNLTRFGLFYPEKRDFFLENSNFFTMGTGSAFTTTPVQTDLFFSRRIGLSDAGTPIPILGGVRVAGKSGAQQHRRARHPDRRCVRHAGRELLRRPLQPRRPEALARRRDLHQQGQPSAATRTSTARWASTPTSRRAPTCRCKAIIAKTETPGKDGNDMAFFGRIAYRDPKWNLYLNYLDVQENFNAEAGFVQRTGIRTTKGHFSPTPRPKKGNVKLFEPMYVLTYTTDQTNRLVGRTASPDARHHAARRHVHQRVLPEDARRARRAVPDPSRRDDSGRHATR